MSSQPNASARILCTLGGHSDERFVLRERARPGESMPASMPARAHGEVGGCAHNIAAALAALGHPTTHAGIRGDDPTGDAVAGSLAARGVADAALVIEGIATGRYAALVEPDGTLALAAAAMDAYDRADELADHAPFRAVATRADALVLDANGPAEAIGRLAAARGPDTRLVLLATSAGKASALRNVVSDADLLYANAGEWDVLAPVWSAPPALAFVTRGADGAVALRHGEVIAERPAPAAAIVDVIGAGDAFAAGSLSAWLGGSGIDAALERGLAAAGRCVAAPGALGWLDRTEGR